MKQATYDQVTAFLKTQTNTQTHTPDQILNNLIQTFPNEKPESLTQIRQQWYSNFMKYAAPSVYCYLDRLFPKYSYDGLVTLEEINGIMDKFKAIPQAWIVKHILTKSRFGDKLGSSRYNLKLIRRKMDKKPFSELSNEKVVQYILKYTVDFHCQMKP